MKIKGKEYPLNFGINQSILYCELRGINITEMNEEITKLSSGDYTGGEFRDLMWSAMKDGARRAKIKFELDNYDVGDLMENMGEDEITAFVKEMSDTLPDRRDDGDSKKKVTNRK